MARNIPSKEKQRPTTKTTLPSEDLNYNGRQNKEIPKQKKAERIYLHQTSTARYAKGTAIRRGRTRVPIKMNPKKPTPRHIIIKMQVLKQRKNLISSKGEARSNIQRKSNKASSLFLNRNSSSQESGKKSSK